MDLNTKIKDVLKDEYAIKLIEESIPSLLKRREVNLFLNKPLKFVLGKGKYANISDYEVNSLVEKIIQQPLSYVPKIYRLKKIKTKMLQTCKLSQFNSYNDITIPMIIISKGSKKRLNNQAFLELIPLVWDDANTDHHLNYEKHFISWNNLVVKSEYISSSKEHFINAIIHGIQKGFYIYLFVNEGYIKESKRFGMNFDHDLCIYGFNSNNNSFNIMGYLNSNFSFVEISYDLLADAFFNQVSKMPSLFKLKPRINQQKYSKKSTIGELIEFYHPSSLNKGINIYDCLLQSLEKTKVVDYRYYSIINDHCLLISQILSKYFDLEIVSKYNLNIKLFAEKLFLLALTARKKNHANVEQFISHTKKLQFEEKEFAKILFASIQRGTQHD